MITLLGRFLLHKGTYQAAASKHLEELYERFKYRLLSNVHSV